VGDRNPHTPAVPDEPRVLSRSPTGLVARSGRECRLYIELHPHDCGESNFPVNSVLERTDRGLIAKYAGKCPRCGRERAWEFVLDEELPTPTAYGGASSSRILDPGEFLYAADRDAKLAPDTLKGLTIEAAVAAKVRLEDARAAIDEVLKFIPADRPSVPSSALHSNLGREMYLKEPGRFERARLEAVGEVYRKGVEQYAREIDEMKYGTARAEMSARAEQTAKAILDELDAPEDPQRAAEIAAKETEDAALLEVFYVKTGQRSPTAKTRAEMQFAARLAPCTNCGMRDLGELAVTGSGTTWTVSGACRHCGAPQSRTYTSKGPLLPDPSDGDELGPGQSLLIVEKAFRAELARVTPSIGSDPAARRIALVCLTELAKLVRRPERDRLLAERDRIRGA
jgi:hypothetical protein